MNIQSPTNNKIESTVEDEDLNAINALSNSSFREKKYKVFVKKNEKKEKQELDEI